MNRKNIIIGIIVVLAVATAATLFLLRSDEDTWLCQNGQWVRHGNPSAPMPISGCNTAAPSSSQPVQSTDIEVFLPQSGSIVQSPLIFQGKARGSWFFEATAPVRILDAQGKELGAGYIQAIGDWMTADFVPFMGELVFDASSSNSGILVFNNDNPSGLPQNSKEFRMPITINPEPATLVKAYFNNDRLDPEFSCNKVFAVSRVIPKTQSIAQSALRELLGGLTEDEKLLGFSTSLNPNVKIQKLAINDGVASVDFDETLEQAVGGSCRVSAIRSQITETLRQFSTIKSVIISINGRMEDILQP